MKDKFPIKIHKREHEQGIKFIAITSLGKIMKTSQEIEHQLKFVELDYTITLIAAREALNATKQNNKGNVLAFWLLGNVLIEFLQRLEKLGFYLVSSYATFARDLGMGASSVKKILSFRKRFPTVLLIDSTVSWSRYRDNKVPTPAKNKS